MAFKDFPDQRQGVALLQRSLERGRLAHGYLFTGPELGPLELLSRTLAKTLNCLQPLRRGGVAVDCCDQCVACRKIEHGNHADVHWVRPESKTRIIAIEQMRDLMKEIQLKATEAEYKVAVVVAADRLRAAAGNAFLKTLEEPPAKSVLILLSTEPQQVLETILSRCLRVHFGGAGLPRFSAEQLQWVTSFSEMAASGQKSLLGRYRLMDVLLRRLNESKASIEAALGARSPLEQFKDAEKELIEKWEAELSAAVEAEYRRARAELLGLLQCWFRDVWLLTLNGSRPAAAPASAAGQDRDDSAAGLLNLPQLRGTREVARRISQGEATANLQVLEQMQSWLGTNVQEALALEVGLLKLRL